MKFGKVELFLKNNSSTILSIIGAAGVVATAVMSAKAYKKIDSILIEVEEVKGEELTTSEKIVNSIPAFVPAIAMGTGTIICIFGANYLNKKQQASLVSAYSMLSSYFGKYRASVGKLYGEDADKKVMSDIFYNDDIIEPNDDRVTFIFEYSQEYIHATEAAIVHAESEFNKRFTYKGYASVNELREYFGLPQVAGGDSIGWVMSDGCYWVDFDHIPISKEDDSKKVYLLTTELPPDVIEW